MAHVPLCSGRQLVCLWVLPTRIAAVSHAGDPEALSWDCCLAWWRQPHDRGSTPRAFLVASNTYQEMPAAGASLIRLGRRPCVGASTRGCSRAGRCGTLQCHTAQDAGRCRVQGLAMAGGQPCREQPDPHRRAPCTSLGGPPCAASARRRPACPCTLWGNPPRLGPAARQGAGFTPRIPGMRLHANRARRADTESGGRSGPQQGWHPCREKQWGMSTSAQHNGWQSNAVCAATGERLTDATASTGCCAAAHAGCQASVGPGL
jgi:hypothetical protein